MSVERHTLSAVTSTAVTLDVRSAQVGLDESRRPYAETILTCALPDEETVALVDPRDGVRVIIELTRNGASKTFDLLLHGRRLDYVDATMELTLRSDEAYLIDAGLAATAPDLSAVADRDSLRAIIAAVLYRYGMSLEVGTADFDFSSEIPTLTNMIPNPSAEVNTTGWVPAGGLTTLTRSTAQALFGAASIAVTANDVSVSPGPALATTILVTEGKQYTFSYYVKTNTTRPCRGTIRFLNGAGTELEIFHSASVSIPGGGPWVRMSVTATAPVGTVKVQVYTHLISASTGNVGYWDGLMLTEGTALHDYFDGATPADGRFYCEWTGATHDSASLRLDAGPLRWTPGVTAWDFLAPLVETSGLRLYCDELRNWWLVPADTILDGLVIVSETINLTEASETVSRSDEWYDSVVIKYEWSEGGTQHVEYDTAGSGGKVLFEIRTSAYPGPGAAEAIRRRAVGRGQVLQLQATSDYSARPWMEIIASPPHGPAQVGVVAAVEWSMPKDTMTIRSRGLVETPPTAWIFDPPGISWASVLAGIDWTEDI